MSDVSAIQLQGKTQTFTANTSGNVPAPVQVSGDNNTSPCSYVVTNTGTVAAFVACESTPAAATTNAVVPTGGTGQRVHVIPPNWFQCTIKGPPGAFFTGITESGTARIMVTPGEGI